MLSPVAVFALLAISAVQHAHAKCAFIQHHYSHNQRQGPSIHNAIPPGRVEDIDDWVRLSSDSLQRFTGKSLLDVMEGVDTVESVHDNERYAVLSHGNQTDPIYNYFNKGAFLTFQWPESEVYSLPSRYSAPDGSLRQDRAKMMQTVVDQDVRTIPIAIRQTKAGDFFQLTNVTLWNVYDDSGEVRLGQTAVFDRTLIQPLANMTVKA